MFSSMAEASDTAKRKARYSANDWITWRNKDGMANAARVTAETIKAAMLATGTQEKFRLYSARTGQSHLVWWWLANNIRRQKLRGY